MASTITVKRCKPKNPDVSHQDFFVIAGEIRTRQIQKFINSFKEL